MKAEEMRLIFKGKILKDELTLEDFKITDGLTIHLVKGKTAAAASDSTSAGGASLPASGTGPAGGSPAGGMPGMAAGGAGANPFAGMAAKAAAKPFVADKTVLSQLQEQGCIREVALVLGA